MSYERIMSLANKILKTNTNENASVYLQDASNKMDQTIQRLQNTPNIQLFQTNYLE